MNEVGVANNNDPSSILVLPTIQSVAVCRKHTDVRQLRNLFCVLEALPVALLNGTTLEGGTGM